MSDPVLVDVGGRKLQLSNLEKILYPGAGFSKAQVIDYYARIAPVLVPHVRNRCMTLRRYPDGIDAESFFEKRCPSHRPEWLGTATGLQDRRGSIEYCRLDEPAALVWTANLAALELHAPLALAEDLETPQFLVFDLDPGAPATITECCQVALELQTVLESVGLQGWAKTSGSKGLQVYVPLNTPHSYDHTSSFALAVGQLLTKQSPARVLVNMAKAQRNGKVFVDWSQNSRHKTTAAVYTMRARATPTVSTPVRWSEVSDAARGGALSFETDDVLNRVEAFGDLFAPTLTVEQQLPHAKSS